MSTSILLTGDFKIPQHICKCVKSVKDIKIRKIVNDIETVTNESKVCNYPAMCIHEISSGVITYSCGADISVTFKSKDFIGMVEESKTLGKTKKLKNCNYKKVYHYILEKPESKNTKTIFEIVKRNTYSDLRRQIRYFLDTESWIIFQEVDFLAKSLGFISYDNFNVSKEDNIYNYCKHLDEIASPSTSEIFTVL
jgi:hypothetical protein